MVDLGYEDLDFDHIFSASHLHVSSFFLHRRLRPQIADMFRAARSRGLTTSMDTNDDPEDKWSDDNDLVRTFGFVDTLFLNEREAKKLARTNNLTDAMAKLAQLTKRVVVKLGARGALAREGPREWRRPALTVNVIDPVGAGDSFDAGYIHCLLQGEGQEACLEYANAAGALSATKEGGTEAFRDRANVARFFHEHLGVI